MHTEASDGANRWAGTPWPEADAAAQRAEMRTWAMSWRWLDTPCPHCLWPFEAFHLCQGASSDPMLKSPTDE